MPSFKIIGLLVLEKKIFKGFYHIWAWRPSLSCDWTIYINFGSFALIGQVVSEEKENVNGRRRTPDPWVSYKLSFFLPKEAPHEDLALIGQVV